MRSRFWNTVPSCRYGNGPPASISRKSVAWHIGRVLTEAGAKCAYVVQNDDVRRVSSELLATCGEEVVAPLVRALNSRPAEIDLKGTLYVLERTGSGARAGGGTPANLARVPAHFARRQSLVGGERYTIADAYLFTVLNWTSVLAVDLGRWPALTAYLARIAARPAVQPTLKAEGLAA